MKREMHVQKNHFVLLLVTLVFSVTGCVSTIPVSEAAVTLNVSFDWTNTSGCASQSPSPPITVSNIPNGTKFLKVNMVDLNNISYPHGGGEVTYDGTGSITEGALNHYQGPCPPSATHTYKITVQALNGDKSLVLGQGSYSRQYPN